MDHVHSQLHPFKERMHSSAGFFSEFKETLADKRKLDFSKPLLPTPIWQEGVLPEMSGQLEFRIFIADPNAAKEVVLKPAILHIHGGGLALRDAMSNIRPLQELVLELDCVVDAVNYHFAPEAPYQNAVENCCAALKWPFMNADWPGVDRDRIPVMSESAGGWHAVTLAITVRDHDEFLLAYQALPPPMQDNRRGSTRKMLSNTVLAGTAEENQSTLGPPAQRSCRLVQGSAKHHSRTHQRSSRPSADVRQGRFHTCLQLRTSNTPAVHGVRSFA